MKRTVLFTGLLMLLFAAGVYAGALDAIKSIGSAVTNPGGLVVGVTTVALLWLFRAIPNDKIYGAVEALFNRIGIVVTLGLSKWKWTAPLWAKTIEPWLVDMLDNTVHAAITGLIAGLRSDDIPEA
jgi:hypothetical protein